MRIVVNVSILLFVFNGFCQAESSLLDKIEKSANKKVWKLKEIEINSDYFVIYSPEQLSNGVCFTKASRLKISDGILLFKNEDVEYLINNYFALSDKEKCTDLDFEKDYFRAKTLIGSDYLRRVLIYVYELDHVKNEVLKNKIFLSEIDIGYLNIKNDFCYKVSFIKNNGEYFDVIWMRSSGEGFEAVSQPPL